jgi:hypothetical protein
MDVHFDERGRLAGSFGRFFYAETLKLDETDYRF